ncbi:DoxX family protein [Micromonospora sp. WMMD812]|uniref:DoxX family protein n=1 Tax=Micromonospora sp. WMMD812 TaxID=3015152 RepID=UPI00248CBA05|nr:DoxX family protein [Micromonospora sp. WMMD812]WBB69071.1 DoxX family protein [Micromonospora sp. WMMD812]
MAVLILCEVVTVGAVVANMYAATADFTRANFVLANSTKVGVPTSWLPLLGTLKAAGAVGLLLGVLGVRYIGVAAAVGLVLFFLGAIGFHVRAHEHHFVNTTVGYFLLAVAALVASIAQEVAR